jgi:hypothetical protein
MNGGMLTRWSLGVLLLILVLVPLRLMAQVTTADVVGTVSDSTGALLPG